MATPFLILLPLFFTLFFNFSIAMSTISAMSKDQISCEMCSSCDNPCQPILSPPPPSPLPSPPPPSPPPPTGTNCPPPPSPPSGGGLIYFSPPPPNQPTYYSPPYGGGGGAYYPPINPYIFPPPPNPIVPYFPYYYYTPLPPNSYLSHSMKFRSHPLISAIIIILISFIIPLL